MGQAVISLCGHRGWSWMAPAIGVSLLCALCWATARLPGEGLAAAGAVALAVLASCLRLRGGVGGSHRALRSGAPVAVAALLAASLPFLVEGRFGILGTGFNPDMSQHLLAAERLADGTVSGLHAQGYPLGPHSVVVALSDGLGIGLVQGFSGLTIAVAVLAALTALLAFAERPPPARWAAALVVGLPYLVASYFAQGAFKETMQALLVLAFLLALREASRAREWSDRPLRFVPAAAIAIGSVYAYSFPGLVWLAAALLLWIAMERRAPLRPLALALVVFAVGALPELGRMIDFQRFETFDPDGPGLGNLFGQVSPFTALGIWFSGDFRVAAGDGAVPAVAYYLGAAFSTALLALGLSRCLRARESAILSGVIAVVGIYLAARLTGTPYQAAKALEVAAPVLALAILIPSAARADGRSGRLSASLPVALYLALAGGCSLLALVNAPVGPAAYSPALAELRPALAGESTLVLAPEELLEEQQGERYLAWELRGGRVCIEPDSSAGGQPPAGIRFVIAARDTRGPPFAGLELQRRAGPYLLWKRREPVAGPGPCPLIAVRQARQGPAGGG
jgi:hypothetical protein